MIMKAKPVPDWISLHDHGAGGNLCLARFVLLAIYLGGEMLTLCRNRFAGS